MRPFFVFIRSLRVRPPGVCFAVPCQTCAFEPTVLTLRVPAIILGSYKKDIIDVRMSRELLGLFALAIVCIAISPLYRQTGMVRAVNAIEQNTEIIPMKHIAQTKNPKTIVLLSDSFLPVTFAGSELSAYETIKYLRSRGHNITIFVKTWKVPEYDGFKIYPFDTSDEFCRTSILDADAVFFQMDNRLELVQERTKPVFIFIHMVNSYPWLIQQKVNLPIVVVYNSRMTQDTLPTLYENMRMIPYVETQKFRPIRELTIQNNVVCLINCNRNKGVELFNSLAKKMPDIQFLGVKGGYSGQVIEKNPPDNLRYIENQKDITVVFKQIGILVMPSINETWGRTAVEAMASGVPVIHSEAGGLVECVGGAGIMCSRNDEDAWMDAIRRIVGDRAYRERLRQNGFRRVEEINQEQERGRRELASMVER